jgi:hypothetical protein
MLLLLAALPAIFWDAPPESAPALREAGVKSILVPAAQLDAWKGIPGVSVEKADPRNATRLPAPAVNYRIDRGGATRAPWLICNGWQFVRNPNGRFYYEVKGAQAPLAAAEAFSYGGNAMIHTDAAGLKPLAEMLEFLRGVAAEDLAPVADIGFIDDGSPEAGEIMNLMVRDNLLFRTVRSPDRMLKVNVQLGTKEYPREEAKNPGMLAHEVRANLSDEKRSLRIYGSQVVVARVTGSRDRVRLQLLNYAGAERKVDGLRVRVLGRYANHRLAVEGSPGGELLDYTLESDATEFTLRELKTYAVIDLSK